MIGIVDYGLGNLRSVQKALEAVGAAACISGEKAVLDGCEKLILPGVGRRFGAGMEQLAAGGLDAYLHMRARDTKMLGICLGMQLLLESSSEEGEHAGLGFIRGRCVRFAEGKVPQIGWNEVRRLQTPLFDGIEEGDALLLRAQLPRRVRRGKYRRRDRLLRRVPLGGLCGERVRRAVPPRKERCGGAAAFEKFCRL